MWGLIEIINKTFPPEGKIVDTLAGIGTCMRLTIGVGSLEGVKLVEPAPILPAGARPSPSTEANDPPDEDREECAIPCPGGR